MKPQMTAAGHERLTHRLTTLKRARTDARERIRTARKFCDFREDVTYTETVRDYERLEAEILELEHLLNEAEIVESNHSDVVTFGNRVVVRELHQKELESYRIVGEAEADIDQGTISITSPIGRTLFGAKVGQLIKVNSPAGVIELEVLHIEP
ncbi:GreA/GreB family elongation factor [Exiguobacterium sp. s22]|uniref:GreA/GreB family elongation factor n=1 Tax=Exiguobacterium sp. s22 TaxID=2751272 RepID=UPI001BEBC9B3|nr:GreA/GreB family elongation factor [Exiguobacterium sp. s22]